MRIKSLETYNSHSKLKINKIEFKSLTLLVGASGVGKTQILRSINKIKSIAHGDSVSGFCWNVEFNAEGNDYQWSGEFEALEDYDDFTYGMFHFDDDDKVEPKIIKEEVKINGSIIITRSGDDIVYNDSKTVKLASTVSIVHTCVRKMIFRLYTSHFHELCKLMMMKCIRCFLEKIKMLQRMKSLASMISERSHSL